VLRTRSILLALLVSAAAWLAATGTAQAHTSLSSSSPAEGVTVTEPLSMVTLTFSGGVRGPEVTVTGPDGAVVSTAPASDEGSTVSVPVAPTATGPHTVTWAVTSADGHDLTGTLGFDYAGAVAAPVAEPVTSVPASAPTPEPGSSAPSPAAPTSAPLDEAGADAPEDGPNLLVRVVPVVLALGVGGGVWLLLRRRRGVRR